MVIIKMRLQFKTESLLLRVQPVLYYGLSFIVEELGLYSKTTVEAWFKYFSTGDPQYYGEMMSSLEKDALES